MIGSKDISEKEKESSQYIDESCFIGFEFSDMKKENKEVHSLGKYQ